MPRRRPHIGLPHLVLFCAVLALGLASGSPTAAAADCAERMAGDPAAWRVLPPGTEGRVRRAGNKLGPGWHFDGAAVVCDRATLTVCTAPGQGCHEVTLSDPSVRCDGTEAGGWCVGQGPSAPRLAEVLAAASGDVGWVELRERPAPQASSSPGASAAFPWRAVGLAWAWLLLPVLLGMALARLLASRPRARFGVGILVVLAAPATLAQTLGVWDTLLPALLFAAAMALAARTPRIQALVLGATGLALVVGELLTLIALPAPGAVPPPERARLGLQPEDWDPPCMSLHPDLYGSADTRLTDWGDIPRRVLHLGDSMVFGGEVAAEDTFVGRLDLEQPAVQHLNLGVPDTGLDHHLLALRAWLPRVQPERVVLYVYAGNDLQDIGRRYACCDLGPLLDFDQPGLPTRCSEPSWRLTPRGLLARSPAPYPLRVAAHWSGLAAHAVNLLPRLTHPLDRDDRAAHGLAVPPDALPRHRGLMEAVAAELRTAGIDGLVVGLPYRRAVEGEHDDEAHAWLRGMLDNASAAGLEILDATPAFSERPPGFWAGGDTWNEHLGPLGHGRVATLVGRALD